MVSSQLERTQEEAWVVIMGRKSRAKESRRLDGKFRAFQPPVEQDRIEALDLIAGIVLTQRGIDLSKARNVEKKVKKETGHFTLNFKLPRALMPQAGLFEMNQKGYMWILTPTLPSKDMHLLIQDLGDISIAIKTWENEGKPSLVNCGVRIFEPSWVGAS